MVLHEILGEAQAEPPVGAVPRCEARNLVKIVPCPCRTPRRGHGSVEAKVAGECCMLAVVIPPRYAVRVREETHGRAGDLLEACAARGHFVPRLRERDVSQDWVAHRV